MRSKDDERIRHYFLSNEWHRIITKESGRSEEGVLTSMRRGQGYKFVRMDGIYISIPDHAVAYISVYEMGGE